MPPNLMVMELSFPAERDVFVVRMGYSLPHDEQQVKYRAAFNRGICRFSTQRKGAIAMLLYDFKPAPNPRRVRMFLAEKGVSIPTVQVSLFKGETKLQDFLAKNPFARVPVLELDDGKFLSESVAICRYIEEQNPAPPMFGRNTQERVFIEMWQRSAEFELLFPIANVFRHGTEFGKGLEPNQNSAWAETCRGRALQAMKIFDTALRAHPFIAGSDFSIADITALCAIDFGANTGAVQMPDDLQNLKRWHGAVSARPSAAA